jgi:hypothetical protein
MITTPPTHVISNFVFRDISLPNFAPAGTAIMCAAKDTASITIELTPPKAAPKPAANPSTLNAAAINADSPSFRVFTVVSRFSRQFCGFVLRLWISFMIPIVSSTAKQAYTPTCGGINPEAYEPANNAIPRIAVHTKFYVCYKRQV